jgi:excisionase family DNA binding protein
MKPDVELVLTRTEAAKKARLGLSAFDEALRRGDFPSLRVGRKVLIPRKAFEAVLAGEATK